MNSEIQYLNEKISRLVTERNEAEAKLEIFRIEIQNLRDHIASPIVQKNIREKVMRAKKILEKKNNSKEDIGSLKTLLLHLEDGFARVSENEKIYHRLLLQKEVEVKGLKDLIGDKGKCGGFDQGMSTIASSPIGSIENGLHRKTQSFTLLMEDGGTMRRDLRKERVCEVGENKLIDELALYKVKYALFEENASERLDKIKELVKDLKKTGDHGKIDDILQMVIRPIETPDLQLDDY